jgi:hypothetical protein
MVHMGRHRCPRHPLANARKRTSAGQWSLANDRLSRRSWGPGHCRWQPVRRHAGVLRHRTCQMRVSLIPALSLCAPARRSQRSKRCHSYLAVRHNRPSYAEARIPIPAIEISTVPGGRVESDRSTTPSSAAHDTLIRTLARCILGTAQTGPEEGERDTLPVARSLSPHKRRCKLR